MPTSQTKRNCGVCKQSGHQARTCPKAATLFGPDSPNAPTVEVEGGQSERMKLLPGQAVTVRNWDGRGGRAVFSNSGRKYVPVAAGPRYQPGGRYFNSYKFAATTPYMDGAAA